MSRLRKAAVVLTARLILAVAVAGLAAMPPATPSREHQADPDKKMAGGGTLPSGWKGRVDGTARWPASR